MALCRCKATRCDAVRAPEPLKMPYQQVLIGGIHAAIEQHRIEPMMWGAAGQSIAFFNERATVGDIIDRMMAEAEAAVGGVRAAQV